MKKQSKLSHDGTNLLTRIPRKIEQEADLKKGDKLEWAVNDGSLKVSKINSKENQESEK